MPVGKERGNIPLFPDAITIVMKNHQKLQENIRCSVRIYIQRQQILFNGNNIMKEEILLTKSVR